MIALFKSSKGLAALFLIACATKENDNCCRGSDPSPTSYPTTDSTHLATDSGSLPTNAGYIETLNTEVTFLWSGVQPIAVTADDRGLVYPINATDNLVVVTADGSEPLRFVPVMSVCYDPDRLSTTSPTSDATILRSGEVALVQPDSSCIHAVDPITGDVRPIAGGNRGFGGDGGPALEALFNVPCGVAEGDDGALYVADQHNYVVREVRDEQINTVVGTPGVEGFAGDGGLANQALLGGLTIDFATHSNRVAIDGRRLFIADACNQVIRVVDLDSGVIDRYAGRVGALSDHECVWGLGTFEGGYSGDGGAALSAELNFPVDIAVCKGIAYITDQANHCIRRVGADGIISTVAGRCGERGYAGDGGPATEALLSFPNGADCAPNGDLYIADASNSAIRRVIQPELAREE